MTGRLDDPALRIFGGFSTRTAHGEILPLPFVLVKPWSQRRVPLDGVGLFRRDGRRLGHPREKGGIPAPVYRVTLEES